MHCHIHCRHCGEMKIKRNVLYEIGTIWDCFRGIIYIVLDGQYNDQFLYTLFGYLSGIMDRCKNYQDTFKL